MILVGKFVKTFAEASHALPMGINLDADYPLKSPPIAAVSDTQVMLQDLRGETWTVGI